MCLCVSCLKFKIPLEYLPFVSKAVSLPLAELPGLLRAMLVLPPGQWKNKAPEEVTGSDDVMMVVVMMMLMMSSSVAGWH